jgi:peptidoglycan/xylan/chitin deacetylase (PgdA/CDA1 family)
MKLKKKAKSILSKLKFNLQITPRIDKCKATANMLFIPPPYKAVAVISADFEMAWASRFTKNSPNPLSYAIKSGRLTRRNMPIILDLCDKYNIPITWATVGHLMLEKCEIINNNKHPDIKRLSHFENEFWKFDKGDWFDFDPCTNYCQDPEWYAPDLVDSILSQKVQHEIGCHTFSHIDCSDAICSEQVFMSEINTCKKIAKDKGLKLHSFVHPGHQIGHLNDLAKLGFTSYRTDSGDTLSYPYRHSSGLWELKNTAEFAWRDGWSAQYHINRYKTIINRAINYQKVCVLWFHPSLDTAFVDNVLSEVLAYLNKCRNEIAIMTHGQYIEYLERTVL